MKLVGIFGGTFDPVHHGHLRMAQEVLDATPMSELRFIPCHVPPHRDTPEASADIRVRLLLAALDQGDPRLRIDTRELERPGPSYMVDTLTSLRDELGESTSLALILGVDAMRGLPGWSRWMQLTSLAHLIILGRPGHGQDWPEPVVTHFRDRLSDNPERLLESPQGAVIALSTSQLEISASQIRRLVATGKSARYLTPESVLKEIERGGLYRQT